MRTFPTFFSFPGALGGGRFGGERESERDDDVPVGMYRDMTWVAIYLPIYRHRCFGSTNGMLRERMSQFEEEEQRKMERTQGRDPRIETSIV